MANWKRLARSLALADGNISDQETEIIHKELTADQQLDKEEIGFLIDLKKSAKSVAPKFNQFVLTVVKKVILRDGVISEDEAKWLYEIIAADGKLDAEERKLIQELKKEAKQVSATFLKLHELSTQG
jgi:uncharacterized tellurite resistance protein B-like protein